MIGRYSRLFFVASILLVVVVQLWSTRACISAATFPSTPVVTVHVLDTLTRAPIMQADVRIRTDAIEYTGITNSKGIVEFRTVRYGTYGVFTHHPEFSFLNHNAITVDASSKTAVLVIVGLRVSPKLIGTVESRASLPPDPSTERSLEMGSTLIGGSVGSSLGSLAQVGSAVVGSPIQLHNESGSLTTATINGAPIFPAGSPVSNLLFSTDIFSAANVSGGTIGAPNGSLNFSTLAPTIDWNGLSEARVASFGAASYNLQERGTTGRFGVAASHGARTDELAFNDSQFLDTSGTAYLHDTSKRSEASIFTIRYGFDPAHVMNLDVGSLATSSMLTCTVRTGPLPCGYGPGNQERRSVTYFQLRDQLETAKIDMNVNLFRSTTSDIADFSRETIENQRVGFYDRSMTERIGAASRISFALSERRKATLTLSATSDSVKTSGIESASGPIATRPYSQSAASLAFPAIRTRKFEDSVNVGFNDAGSVSQFSYGTQASYLISTRDSVRASFSSGALASRTNSFFGVDPPQLLNVDCASEQALGNGPTFGALPGSTDQVAFNYIRHGPAYQASFGAFHHVARQSPVSAALPFAALPPSLFSSSYLKVASSIASSECRKLVTLKPTDLLFVENAPVSHLSNDGIDFGASFDVNQRANVSADYSLSLQHADGASALFVAGSTIAPGNLLAGATIARLNASTRYATSRATTVIANLNVIGPNNPYSRKAFVSEDFGVRAKSENADFIFAVQNVSNAHGIGFGSFDPFPVLELPYVPRTISVRVRIALGRQKIDGAEYLTKPFGQTDPSSLIFQESEYGPMPARGWLLPDTNNKSCGPETLLVAKRYFYEIQSYANGAQETLVTGETSRKPSMLDDMSLSQLKAPSGNTVRVAFTPSSKNFKAFLRCASLHTGTYDQARSLGVFIPSWQQSEKDSIYVLYYSPIIGLYFPPNPVDETTDSFIAKTTVPAKAPKDPFSVSDACPDSFRLAVTEAANSLKTYITVYYRGDKSAVPEGFLISKHLAKADTWLEIRADNNSLGDALAQCLDVPAINIGEIAKRGLGAANPPSINFTPSIGFYMKSFL